MARQPYVEIDYVQGGNELSLDSEQMNNVSNISELGQKKSFSGFKGMYVNAGNVGAGQEDYGTKLDGSYKFFSDSGYPGWNSSSMSGISRTPQGSYLFNNRPTITISLQGGESFNFMTIVFDQESDEYAKTYMISGRVYDNDNAVCFLELPDGTTSVTLTLIDWSKPNSVAKISRVGIGYSGSYDESVLKSVVTTIEDCASPNDLKFGISGTTGKLEIFDLNQQFDYLNSRGLLQSKREVQIWARDILNKNDMLKIATLETSIWTRDENSPIISVTLEDKLQQLQNIQVSGYALAQRTGLEAFYKVFDDLGWHEGYDYHFLNLDGTEGDGTKIELEKYVFPNFFGTFGTAWKLLDMICIATMCRIYTGRDGRVCIKKVL